MLEVVTIGGLVVATLAQTAFVIIYGTASPWLHGFVGRSLFFKSAVLSIAFDITVIRMVWEYPFQRQVGAVLMTLLAAAVVYQLAALLKQRRLSRGATPQHASPQP